jgi:lysophospholipase L1-like esterase
MRIARLLATLCLLLTVGAAEAPRQHVILAATPISRMDLHWWRTRFEAKQAELKREPPQLVFYGDSITENWERHGPPDWMDFAPVWQRFYGDRRAVNLGFIGDTTANLLWRIGHGEADGISPKVAVILIGANNLGRVHWSTEDTLAGIDAIVRALHQRLPQTKLLLLGILPSDRTPWATETTVAVNRALASRYRDVPGVTFLDVSHVFMSNGVLTRALYYDPKETPPGAPLHPTAQGQALLSEAIEPALATLLGDHPHK